MTFDLFNPPPFYPGEDPPGLERREFSVTITEERVLLALKRESNPGRRSLLKELHAEIEEKREARRAELVRIREATPQKVSELLEQAGVARARANDPPASKLSARALNESGGALSSTERLYLAAVHLELNRPREPYCAHTLCDVLGKEPQTTSSLVTNLTDAGLLERFEETIPTGRGNGQGHRLGVRIWPVGVKP